MIFPKGLASSQSQEKYVISIFLALPVKRGIGTVSRCKVGPDGESPPQGWDGVGGLRDGMHWLCCCCFDCCLQFHRFSLKFPLEWLKIPKFSRLRRKKTPARCARRQGWGQLDYPDRHHHAYPLRTPRRRPPSYLSPTYFLLTLLLGT